MNETGFKAQAGRGFDGLIRALTVLRTRIVCLSARALSGGSPQCVPVPVRGRSRRRGAGMLEYALVALISIAVFGILISQFSDILGDLADNIRERLGV